MQDSQVLAALRGFEPVEVIVARLGLTGAERNDIASALHRLSKAGECYRRQDGHNWVFSAVAPQEFTVAVEEEYPSWAKRLVWQASDGPYQDVFASRPPGHRCLFSCQWVGLKSANETDPVEGAPKAQWYYELCDLAARGVAEAGSLILELEPRDESLCWSRYGGRALTCLLEERRRYPETASYVAPWALTPRVRYLRWRPGYEVILPPDERLARRHGDGVWLYITPTHPKGIPLCEAEDFGGPSDAEERIARKALIAAQKSIWG